MRQKRSRQSISVQKIKYAVAMILGLAIVMSTGIQSVAHEVPDLDKKGTITVTMKCGDDFVAGGTLTAYRVGDIVEDDGNYDFELNEDFKASDVKLYEVVPKEDSEIEEIEMQTDELQFVPSPQKAKDLAAYAKTKGIKGKTETIGDNGKVVFKELEPALYLFVQNKAAEGYYAADSFLVSLPSNEEGAYIYDVDATPKVELEKQPVPPPPGPLPQTGQLNWPIPVLAILGVVLFAAGWVLKIDRKNK